MKVLRDATAAVLAALMPFQPGLADPVPQDSGIIVVPTGEKLLQWHGHEGRTYFLQASDPNQHLQQWIWAPVIEAGNDSPISYEVGGTAPAGFFRLHHTDAPVPPGLSLEEWDADGDGLANALELGLQGHPLAADTSGDGIPDGWAHAHGLSLTADHASTLFPNSSLTFLEAWQAGVQAHPSATPEDLDGDGVPNDEDAEPSERLIDWSLQSSPSFAALRIPLAQIDEHWLDDLTDSGTMLFSRVENGGVQERIVIDRNLDAHSCAASMIQPVEGVFHAYGRALIEDMLPGEEIVNGSLGEFLWEPVEEEYLPWDWSGTHSSYHDEILDSRKSAVLWHGPNFAEPQSDIGLWMIPGNLLLTDDEELLNTATGKARIEKDGNVSNGNAYWRWNETNEDYDPPVVLPAPGFPRSATLEQPAATGSGLQRWNLVAGQEGLMISKDGAGFATALGDGGNGQVLGVTHHGWIWRDVGDVSQFRVHGEWQDLTGLLGNDITEARVLDMMDTGLAVARVRQGAADPFGVLMIPFEILLSGEKAEVSADDAEIHLVARIGGGSPGGPEVLQFDDSVIEWEIEEGAGGTILETETIVKDGLSSTTLATSTTAGDTFKVRARIKSLRGVADVGGISFWGLPATVEVVPGRPHTLHLIADKIACRSDGTDLIEIGAEVLDEAGNPVADGTPVSWSVDQSPTPPFAHMETETTAGRAVCVARAPLVPGDRIFRVEADDAFEEITVQVERVTGSLTGDINLNVGAGASTTVTASVDAVNGTPVFWSTSNGEITLQSAVQSGTATATLNTNNGRLGKVVVSASVGDRLLVLEGNFVSGGELALGADHPVIIADAAVDGVDTIDYDHGIARQIPHYASTPVRVRGPANQQVAISIQTSLPVAEWDFVPDEDDGVLPGHVGEHPVTLAGGTTLDSSLSVTGTSSLAMDGSGHALVPAHSDFDFTDQFEARLWVRPAEDNGASTLLEKSGSWKIELLGDGCVRTELVTDQGTFAASSQEPLPPGEWSELAVDFRFGGLVVTSGNRTIAQAAVPGDLVQSQSDLLVGDGFSGHIDALSLRAAAPSGGVIAVTGLAQDSTITLDATGNGTFTVASLGNAPHGLDIHIESSYNPRFRTKIRAVGKWLWNAVSDCAISFVGGDPQTTAGTVASIAGGILIVGDIGSVCKNLWRMTSFSDTPPNYVELVLGGLGVVTSGLAITGVGAAVPVAIAPLKTLAIRLGNEGTRMITAYVDLIRRSVSTGGNQFTQNHLQVVLKMAGDDPLAVSYRGVKHTDDLVNASARGGSRFGAAADAYHQGVKRAADVHGPLIARNLIKVLDGLDEAALASLKNLPTSQLDDALDGLARVLSKGVNPKVMTRVLDNHHVYGIAYTRVNLLKDLDLLADVPGMPDIARMLQVNHPNVKGFRYEVEGAAYLSRTNLEDPVTSLTQRVSVIWDDLEIDTFGGEMIKKFGKKTDIDVITGNPPTHIFRQLKSTAGSMKSLTKVKAWCEKARKARTNDGDDYTGLVFHLPPDEIPKISKNVKEWLISKNIPIIPINMAQ